MGKTARWFRGLLGGKKESTSSSSAAAGGDGGGGGSDSKPPPKKKKWSFIRSFKEKELTSSSVNNYSERKGSYRESNCSSSTCSYLDGIGVDPNKHAIAVAAATAAVAEHAVAAAHAAAAVVKLTSSGRSTTTAYVSISSSSGLRRENWAALKIQSAFRGYLARRALKALKGLVKLQALVRGHIVRKKTAETVRCMQALVRVQIRARAGRTHDSEFRHRPNFKSSLSHQPGPVTPEKYEHGIRSKSTRHDRPSSLKRNSLNPNNRDIVDQDRVQMGLNWLDHWMDENSWNQGRETLMKNGPPDDEKSDKILEIDPGKPHFNSKLKNSFSSAQHIMNQDRNSYSITTMDSPSKDSTTAQLSVPSTSSGEVQSINHRRFPHEVENAVFCTAENSPQFYSTSSRHGSERRGPFTPAKSEDSKSFLSGYSDYPNYMANTESSQAKVRSQSAPKQRLEFEKSSSMKRYSVHGFGAVRSSSTSRGSAFHANFTSKAYPGSVRFSSVR